MTHLATTWFLLVIAGCGAANPSVLDRLAATTATTTVADLELTLGKPARDIGSGIHIFVYPIDDGEVRIGTPDRASILYVRVTQHGRERVIYPHPTD